LEELIREELIREELIREELIREELIREELKPWGCRAMTAYLIRFGMSIS